MSPSTASAHSKTRTGRGSLRGTFCAFVIPSSRRSRCCRSWGANFCVSPGAISLVVTASTLAVALAAPFAGVVADRFGRKRVIVPAAFLLAVPTLLAATAGSYGQLLFWRFLQGIFTPGIFGVIIAYINEEWGSGRGRGHRGLRHRHRDRRLQRSRAGGARSLHTNWRWALRHARDAQPPGRLRDPVRGCLRGQRFQRGGAPPGGIIARRDAAPSSESTPRGHLCSRLRCDVLPARHLQPLYVNFYLAAPPFNLRYWPHSDSLFGSSTSWARW